MKNQSGFTLIELVIVIIILGILSATAIPKFVDLQGDARAASLNGVKGALEGAATLTYSKAAIDGVEDDATLASTSDDSNFDFDLVYGYPEASSDALSEAAGLDTSEWTITASTTAGTVYITPADQGEGTDGGSCQVEYTEADEDSRPDISVDTDC